MPATVIIGVFLGDEHADEVVVGFGTAGLDDRRDDTHDGGDSSDSRYAWSIAMSSCANLASVRTALTSRTAVSTSSSRWSASHCAMVISIEIRCVRERFAHTSVSKELRAAAVAVSICPSSAVGTRVKTSSVAGFSTGSGEPRQTVDHQSVGFENSCHESVRPLQSSSLLVFQRTRCYLSTVAAGMALCNKIRDADRWSALARQHPR